MSASRRARKRSLHARKTPNEIALNILLASLTIIFVVVVLVLGPIAGFADAAPTLPVLVALLVCLIPTTIGALLSAIGIAGMDRLVQHNVLAMSGRAVEAAGDVTTLLLDKTGTITYGNRQASEFTPVGGAASMDLVRAAALASLSDPTPEGSSVVTLASQMGFTHEGALDGDVVPFTAQTRMSGVDFTDGTSGPQGRCILGDRLGRRVRAGRVDHPERTARSGRTDLPGRRHAPRGGDQDHHR